MKKVLFALAGVFAAFAQEREGAAPPAGAKSAYQLEMERQWKLHPTLAIGAQAPDFNLAGIDGKKHTLADYKSSKVLAVMFICNHCPASQLYENRMKKMADDYHAKGVQFIAIQPNAVSAISARELNYTDVDDSLESMVIHAKFRNFNFPYLYDGDTQSTAKAYGCLCTPHIFIFDKDRKLRYMGRVDDSRYADPSTVKSPDARNALAALVDGKPVPVEVTRPAGCSTKWINHNEVHQLQQAWTNNPVTLETINAAGVASLVKNPTSKVRMINVWATWCAPCVAEFPGLVSISQRMSNRDFELITISVDDQSDQAKALAFLQKQHAAASNRLLRSLSAEGRTTNNYLFTGANLDALMQALDPQAPGPVPYTLIIAPGGKIVYRHSGEVDSSELLGQLIDIMGPYYPQAGR